MEPIVFMYVTFPNYAAAASMAAELLDKKLIACANMFAMQSAYRWEGKQVEDQEYVVLFKTTEDLSESVKMAIESCHPYQTPCIAKIQADVNAKYAAWVVEQVA